MGFLGLFKKKKNDDNDEQNNVPQIPSFANINQNVSASGLSANSNKNIGMNSSEQISNQNQQLPSPQVQDNSALFNQSNTQQMLSQNQGLPQLPQQPTQQLPQPINQTIQSQQIPNSHLSENRVQQNAELHQSPKQMNTVETKSNKLFHKEPELHRQVFYENGGLFMDYITYSDFNKALDFSKNTITGLKKAVDFFLSKSEFENITSDYTKLIDDMNRVLLKIDKKLFND